MDYKHILRHHLATLAFRMNYALKNAPEGFAEFSAGHGVRTPKEIILHIVHALTCTHEILSKIDFSSIKISEWDETINAFYNSLQTLDTTIKNLDDPDEKLLCLMYQGPVCDAMTHIGQLMMLRRLAGSPLEGYEFDQDESIQIGKFKY